MAAVLALGLILGASAHAMDKEMDHGSHDAKAPKHADMNHEAMGDDHDHEAMVKAAQEEIAEALKKSAGNAQSDQQTPESIIVTEKLGQYISDGMFRDSTGKMVHLKDLIDTPTIILPVYYTCPSVCNLIQHSFARILPQVSLESGKEIKVISISFDELDDPEMAARTKKNYVTAMMKGMKKADGEAGGLTNFDPAHWVYLTGSRLEIAKVMDSIGFGYKRVKGGFAHPAVVVATAPDGKIVRYLYGTDFLPFDVTMAATEAAEGKVGVSVKRLLSYCFSYDPQGRRYVFDFMRVAGFGIGGFVAILLTVLLLAGRKKRR